MWKLSELRPNNENTEVRIVIEFTPECPGAIPIEWDGSFPNSDTKGKVFTKPLTPTLLERIILTKMRTTLEEFQEEGMLPPTIKIPNLPPKILNEIDDKYFSLWKNLNKKVEWSDRANLLDTEFDYKE